MHLKHAYSAYFVMLICIAWTDFFSVFICRHKIIIVEGNYLLLDDGVWKEISALFDEKWQVLVLLRHMFLIFSHWPWKLYVNSPLKIQMWAYDWLKTLQFRWSLAFACFMLGIYHIIVVFNKVIWFLLYIKSLYMFFRA